MILTQTTYEHNLIHEARFGGYNDIPPGFTEITENEFVRNHFYAVANPSKIEFRQFCGTQGSPVKDDRGYGLINANLFYDQSGMAGVALMDDHHAGKMKYFSFAREYQHPCILLEDSKWNNNKGSSVPRRGIMDYDRILKFERDLSELELKDVEYWLSNDNCPGWTKISFVRTDVGTYHCRTTMDSSD